MQEKIRTIAGEDIEKGMMCYIDDNVLRKINFESNTYGCYGTLCPRDVKKGQFITVEIPR